MIFPCSIICRDDSDIAVLSVSIDATSREEAHQITTRLAEKALPPMEYGKIHILVGSPERYTRESRDLRDDTPACYNVL